MTKAAPIEAALEEFFQLAHNPVRSLPRLALRRFDLQPQLLGNVSADKSANAVILPIGRLGDLGKRRAFFALHQFQDLLGLAAG